MSPPSSSSSPTPPAPDATPFAVSPEQAADEARAYREARAARLTARDGWLTLTHRLWLEDGAYEIGSAPDAAILLAADRAPAHLATVTRAGSRVRLEVAPGAEMFARAARIEAPLDLRSDADPAPDKVAFGAFVFELIQRGDDLAVRVRDADSPARLNFSGVPAYDFDPAWRIVARLEPHVPEREVIVRDGEGRPQTYASPGVAVFERDGKTCRLEPVYEDAQRRRLFFLFGDATNRDETYGGGRFLYAPLPVAGHVLVDFNKTFNPPCAFTPHAVCPLPAYENRLPIRVSAGEKRPL